MSDRAFDNAPDVGGDFAQHGRADHDAPLDYDAQDWEPIEEPSEQHLEMHYTPGGNLELEIHKELDAAARKRILDAQRDRTGARELPDEQELDFAAEFDEARQDAVGREAEPHDGRPFDTGRRFERGWEPERGDEGIEH